MVFDQYLINNLSSLSFLCYGIDPGILNNILSIGFKPVWFKLFNYSTPGRNQNKAARHLK